MADRRGIVLPLIILGWIIFNPGNQAAVRNAELDALPSIEHVIAEEQRQLSVLANSSWDAEFGAEGHTINVTGLEPEKDFAWSAVPSIKARAREQLEYALGDWGKLVLDGETDLPNPTPLYKNITGIVSGKWKRSAVQENVPIPQLNLTQYAPPSPFGHAGHARPFDRNITGNDGEISVRFAKQDAAYAKLDRNATAMSGEIKLTDAETSDVWELQLYGVYFASLGQAIMTTTSSKFSGIFALAHMALSSNTFEAARNLLNESISDTIQDQIDGVVYSSNPWHSRIEAESENPFSTPDCELVVYLQQLAPVASTQYSSTFMDFLERELRFPTGAIMPSAPDMHFSALIFSPDCGYILESQGPPDDIPQNGDHLTGAKIEVLWKHARQHLLVFSLALALQLFLLMRQMREASTPSTRSRISLYAVTILASNDGFVALTFLLGSLFFQSIWTMLVPVGFLAFASVAFFGMRFVMDIWQVQAPERERRVRAEVEEDQRREQRFHEALRRIRAERREREQQQQSEATTNNTTDATTNTTVPAPTTTDGTATSTPLPTTTPNTTAALPIDTGATPIFMPSDQGGLLPIAQPPLMNTEAHVRARMPSFASFYAKSYMLMFVSVLFATNSISWPASVRRIFITILGMCYLSFWIPQIIRNVQRNCRHALNWEFVLGQSLLRLTPFLYFYAYKYNVVFADRNYYILALLAGWVWIQVVILGSQELIGPRWFIRSSWAPPAYDYHPILREDEEGATMPIGFSQADEAQSTPSSPLSERRLSSPTITTRASTAKDKDKAPARSKGKRIFDCAICMQDLEVPVIDAGDTGLGVNLLARRAYMVTPCRHIFHSTCLEGWIKYRLQCPICRETLPPL
ncbi:hypothetical protein AC578_7356 [Pseudocercospora eumusae]|uniref:DSC E3 ubiquitin ligase complex subunit A n=1 Tax=Pseudocercospora eumusae TaxID=321146 RepID=A0A139H4R1_9PEZI|nr:hypothetical protein AC578_7356 [Pseudocercospora eumusae]